MRFTTIPLVRVIGLAVACVSLFAFLRLPAAAAPGDLDPTFGNNGRVFTNIAIINPPEPPYYPWVSKVLVQPDGKILVCGSYWEDGVSEFYGLFIVRYLPDGGLDSSFGVNGKLTNIQLLLYAIDMALQSDGKIVVTGGVSGRIYVRRFTSSGELDITFGNFGTTTFPSDPLDEGTGIAVQSDGKIVVTGLQLAFFPPYPPEMLFRLTATGQFDTSFGPSGTGVVELPPGDIRLPVIQPDGKILFAFRDSVARYNPNGLPDLAFGTAGFAQRPVTLNDTGFSDLVLQPDGKVVAMWPGEYSPATGYRTFIIRYRADGSRDTTLGSNGGLLAIALFFRGNSAFLDNNGGITLAGWGKNVDGYLVFRALRLKPTGFPDPSFGIRGNSSYLMNAGGMNTAFASGAAFQADGKMIVAGYFGGYFSDSHEYIAIARLLGGPSAPAVEVAVSGRVITPGERGISVARITLTDDAGNTRYTQTNSFGYYRFSGVTAGLSYQVSVSSKLRSFKVSTQSIVLTTEMTNINFISTF